VVPDTPTPSRAISSAVIAWTTSRDRPTRRPFRVTSRKSSLPVSRADAGSTQVRRKGACGPWHGEQRGSPVRRGYACAAGTRGSAPGGGCSAGKYACSRWISRYWLAKFSSPTARSTHPHLTGDLIRLRTPDQRVPPGCPGPTRTAARRHAAHARCLLANTSCGIARRLLACVLLVGQWEWEPYGAAQSDDGPPAGAAAVRRTFVHSCGQPCGCFP
jgi:hypothetical protein